MRDWDDLADEIESSLNRFKAEPYGDLMASPARVAGIVIHILQTKAGPKMQPTFTPTIFQRLLNNSAVRKVRQAWDENPASVLLGAAALITATAKLIDVTSSIPSKRAYARATNARVK